MADTVSSACNNCSEVDPLLPVLAPPTRASQKLPFYSGWPTIRYRIQNVSDKGAVLMIVWNVFFATTLLSVSTNLTYSRTQRILVSCLTVLYPVVGWLADCWIGRYHVLKAATYFVLLSILFKGTSMYILPSTTMIYAATCLWSMSAVCYLSCVIQFTTDQSVGASGEELSFIIYWLLWGLTTGVVITQTLVFPFTSRPDADNGLVSFFVSVVCFSISYSLMENFSHLLMTKPQLSNPIKHMFDVLNYARTHDCPQRRSALTYWEDDCPPRIDLGKDKYGGPFSVEEVEDVKTILRLIPVVICAMTFGMGMWHGEFLHTFNIHRSCYNARSTNDPSSFTHNVLYHNSTYLICCLSTLCVPLYHFIVYPILYNYIPSMLKRIGMGMFLLFASFMINSIIELVGQVKAGNSTCMFDANSIPVPIDCSWTLIPQGIYSAGIIMTLFSLVEFLIAQSPWQVKGLLLCIAVNAFGAYTLIGLGIDLLLMNVPIRLFPGCGFFYYGIYTIVTFVVFVLFVIVSKWYKLRKRDDVIPYHMFAEEYFEKNYKLEQRYLLRMIMSTP